uniref:t-SNARE coiled-coil homology domain-containing protein n=1 Tax=Syphacia muris TaxID=451379 RepID=A0A0N5B0G2_9BILA
MSVDKTIEELSSTLSQLGRLVGHINSQVVDITSRINITLDTFDSSVSNIATDARAVTSQVAATVSQVPNAWVFYLLFITLIIVFILLSIILTINLITKCHAIYLLIRNQNGSVSDNLRTSSLPLYDESKPIVMSQSPGQQRPEKNVNQIAIQMEYEPRRAGFSTATNGDLRSRDGSTLTDDDYGRHLYQRRQADSGGRYDVQAAVALPYTSRGADV